MTKTLTEQWREGTLDNGFYYVRSGWSAFIEIRYLGEAFFEGNIEVLSPVPSYEEYQDIIQQNVNQEAAIETYIEDIKRLQEQLKEVNEVLKGVCIHAETEQFECRCGWVEPCKDCNAHYLARDYLEKWGVK